MVCLQSTVVNGYSGHPRISTSYQRFRSFLKTPATIDLTHRMSQPSQADILSALQSQTSLRSRQPPPSSPYGSFTSPETDLTHASTSSTTNNRRLYCPREGCNSLLLLPSTSEWIPLPSDIVRPYNVQAKPCRSLQNQPHHSHLPHTFPNQPTHPPTGISLALPWHLRI
jgi:hypothetical protein